jgi:uncharacterized protein (TIGR04551 family)
VRSVVVIAALFTTATAHADGIAELGEDIAPRRYASPEAGTSVELSGYLRMRGESLYNLDLDAGLTPSGDPLYPVPLADPDGQALNTADTRLRTDVAIRTAGGSVAVNVRVDILDNLVLGSTPEGRPATGRAPGPSASPGQQAPTDAFRVKQAYGEVLTPFGLLAAGRMGIHWGLGLVAHDGECDDCDGGDVADRVAFVTPIAGHLWAVSYDFSASGPTTRRRDAARVIDIEPTDDVRTLTFAVLDVRTDAARERRRAAGRVTVEYGAFVSHRTQDNDVPADYLPTAQPVVIDPGQVVARGYSATAADVWLRLTLPRLRVELEAIYARASVDEPSLVPGVMLDQEVTSQQVGLAAQTEYSAGGALGVGFDVGYASGDPAPGFGAFPAPNSAAAMPGDLDGPQADLPSDTQVDNFRFHPDFRIDRILFREIIGTVTDAIYLRPHARYRLMQLGTKAELLASVAVIASWAVEEQSTPGGARALGIEIDPGIEYRTTDGFRAALEYALFLPGAGFDNRASGASASPAQLVRARLGYYF